MRNPLIHLLLSGILAFSFSGAALAVEIAPRISDREIIERLTRLEERLIRVEEGQRSMQRHIEQRITSLEKRMDDRLDAQWNLMLVIIAGIFGLIGFVVWDRKTALRPLEERLQRMTDDLERDLELKSQDGSRLTRLMDALRELASEDQRLANALQRHFLL